MKLSKDTLALFKNYAGINSNLLLKAGSKISTISAQKNVMSDVTVTETFPVDFGIYDLNEFLGAMSIFEDPADIESVNVLRGANASILYGSQGANGVIVITTKKGKAGKTQVDFNHSTIVDQVSELPDLQFTYGAVNGSDYNWSKTKSNYYQNNYVNEFFQRGVNVTNSISVSGGS